jgi:hypothetical protein
VNWNDTNNSYASRYLSLSSITLAKKQTLQVEDTMISRQPSIDSVTDKHDRIEEIEHVPQAPTSKGQTIVHGDAALAILGTSQAPVHVTPEQDAVVLRKIDKWLLPVSSPWSVVVFQHVIDRCRTK